MRGLMTVTTMCDDKDHWRRPPPPPLSRLVIWKAMSNLFIEELQQRPEKNEEL